jgi:Tol biopolymer transport system component
MLSRSSPRTFGIRSLALLARGAACVAVLVTLMVSCGTARTASESFPHTALYVINADGSGLRKLADDPRHALWGPAWSPDGRQIVVTYVSLDPQQMQNQLYLIDADGTNPRQLTRNDRGNFFATWSPDSTRLAFISQQGSQNETAEIYTINADGSDERRLTNNMVWDYGATWSPDGQQIAFGSQQGGSWQIWLMNADGSNQRPLPMSAHGNAPRWSPDGRFIVLKSDREGNDNIYVITPDGSEQRNVTHDPSINNTPSWSPDSQKVVFWSDREGTPAIFAVNRDGSGLLNLTHGSGLDAQFPSWSPDGTRIVFMAVPVETGIAAFLSDSGGVLLGALLGALVLAALLVLALRRHRKTT